MPMQKQLFFGTLSPVFKGIGQIMLQNNIWTGLFFFAGICCGSLMMGLAVMISVAIGTLTSILLKYDKDEVNNGIYGFSPALVGVALICFFQPTVLVWVAIVVGSVLAAIIQHFFLVKKIPAFTFPFILVTWLYLVIVHLYPPLVQPALISKNAYVNDYVSLFSHGFGQVIFQDGIWAGILFMIGIFMSRPIAALYAIVSILISGMMALLLRESINDIYQGLLSYNAVLCAITFAGNKKEDLLFTLMAVVLSVLIMMLMRHMNLPALTFPFVLASWLVLVMKSAKTKEQLRWD